MKKRTIACLIVLGMMLQVFAAFPTSALAAYSYSYEGESFADTNWKVNGQSNISESQVSGGKHLSLYTTDTPEEYYYVEYSVSVLLSGVYDLELASSPVYEGSWASRIYVSVNGGEEVLLDGIYNELVYDKISWYSCDALNLNSGKNTIRFIVRDKISSGYYSAFLDCFKLTRSSSKVRHIITNKGFNVFEDDEEVILTVKTNNLVVSDMQVPWSIKNYYGNSVKEGSVTVTKGTNSADISITDLPLGYYEVSANGVSTGFSVVKALEDRNSCSDSPFASDISFCGSIYYRYGRLAEAYGRVAALSGVKWVRDRVKFTDIVSGEKGNYTITGNSVNRAAEVLKPYGIKSSMVVDYMPEDLLGDYSTYIPDDLVGSYELWKQVAEKFDGKVDNWEVFNETDLGGTTKSHDAPNLYAAFVKSAALGIADAGCINKTTASTQGACEKVDSDEGYVRMLMKNDILDFSAIDNTHEHKKVENNDDKYYEFSGVENVQKHIEEQEAQKETAPLWVTEAGINIKVPENTDFTLEEQRLQAKYLVTSAVESIASGTDKHFFFLGTFIREDDVAWGMMNEDMTYPYMYASFAAQSAMTNILGEGKYLGKITGLPDGICGYNFENAGKTIAVLWSENASENVTLDSRPEKAYDIFGNEIAAGLTYEVSQNPCYLQFSENALTAQNDRREMLSLEERTFTDVQKVILTQKYSETARGASRASGYFINENDNTVTVEVTNLSDKTMTGKIIGAFENGWSLSQPELDITVAPKAVKSVIFSVIPRFDIAEDYLSFWGEFDGQKTSRSAARLKSRNDNQIIIEAEDSFVSDDFVLYENGISLNADDDGAYKASVDVNIPSDGYYNIRVLAGNEYGLYAENKLLGTATAAEPEYTMNGVSVGWTELRNVYLKKGNNRLDFVAEQAVSMLDKMVIDRCSNLWLEAEKYSERSGYYAELRNSGAANDKLMRLFTYGMEFPTSENRLSYDFYVDNSGSYDIWMLSSAPNVTWHTKWKWGLDSAAEAYPTPETSVSAYDLNTTVPMYWYLVKRNASLDKGLHTINILGDAEREAGEYALHNFDTIVVAKSGSFTPSGIVDEDKAAFAAQELLSGYELDNIKDNLYLPEMINEDVTIKWKSSNADVISNTGVVTRPVYGTGDIAVTLTAEIKCGEYIKTRTYDAVVAEGEKISLFNVGFKDEAGNATGELVPKTTVELDIVNYTGDTLDVDLWCGVYNIFSGRLIAAQKRSIEADEGQNAYTLSVNVSEYDVPVSMMKVFTWNSGMKPYIVASALEGGWNELNKPVVADNKVYISGKTKAAGEQVSAMVLKKADIEYSQMNAQQLLGSIIYVTEATTDENGKYMFSFEPDVLEESTVVVGSRSMLARRIKYD